MHSGCYFCSWATECHALTGEFWGNVKHSVPPVGKFSNFRAQKGEYWCILGATFAVELNENWLGY